MQFHFSILHYTEICTDYKPRKEGIKLEMCTIEDRITRVGSRIDETHFLILNLN